MAKSEQVFANVTLPRGVCFVPRILKLNEKTLRCFFTYEDQGGKGGAQMWYRDLDLASLSFESGIHKEQLKMASGTHDMRPELGCYGNKIIKTPNITAGRRCGIAARKCARPRFRRTAVVSSSSCPASLRAKSSTCVCRQRCPRPPASHFWAGELWSTINRIPQDQPGNVRPTPAPILVATTPYFRFSSGEAGRVLFQNTCSACHSLDDTKLVGPSLHKFAGSKRTVRDASGKLREVKADATYLRQSILEPHALLVDGYPENLMPPVGATLTEDQIEALVKYILKASNPK